jgi:GNAT superfamily N-acetyltransferase
MQPSWQNSSHSINRDLENHHVIGAYHNNSLVGYAAFVPAIGRIRQCGVHIDHRRKGVGRALFQYMFEHSGNGQLMLTNVDEAYQPAIRFLYAMQFQPFLRLYEMNGAWPRSLEEK